jgi:hypothetical protein
VPLTTVALWYNLFFSANRRLTQTMERQGETVTAIIVAGTIVVPTAHGTVHGGSIDVVARPVPVMHHVEASTPAYLDLVVQETWQGPNYRLEVKGAEIRPLGQDITLPWSYW